MGDSKDTIKNKKDMLEGKSKETIGKIIGNEQLELKGKLQAAKADIKEKMDISDKMDEAKEEMAKKVNHALDKRKKK